jgi:hypothetical protein
MRGQLRICAQHALLHGRHALPVGPLPDTSRRAAARGRDPGDGSEQDGDRDLARHFLPAPSRHPARAQAGVAGRLGKLFGGGDGTWTRMQAAYDTWQAEQREDVSGIPTIRAKAA